MELRTSAIPWVILGFIVGPMLGSMLGHAAWWMAEEAYARVTYRRAVRRRTGRQ